MNLLGKARLQARRVAGGRRAVATMPFQRTAPVRPGRRRPGM